MFSFTKKPGALEALKAARGSSDDATVILTLTISAVEIPAEAAAYALGADSPDEFLSALFRSPDVDKDQNPKLLSAGAITADYDIKNGHKMKIGDLKLMRTSRVYGLTVQPRAFGLSDVRFTATIHDPPEAYLDQLARLLHVPTTITIEQLAQASTKSTDERQGELQMRPGDDATDESTRRAKKKS